MESVYKHDMKGELLFHYPKKNPTELVNPFCKADMLKKGHIALTVKKTRNIFNTLHSNKDEH